MAKKKFKFKKGDTVKLKRGNINGFLPNNTNVITRVENVDLKYEHQFIFFEIYGREHAFYSQAFEIAK